jgi:ABC-type uncharacterized transport system ATPase subunit
MGLPRSSDRDVNGTLELRNISRRFGATTALADVSFDVAAGEVHALLGENGAGKSTLMHIAYGMLRPDAGTISIRSGDGTVRTAPFLASPRAARRAGIGMVHQHFTSIAAFTVAENIALSAGWEETGRRAERRAAEMIRRSGLSLDPAAYVESLSVQLRQRLEIVKALAADARIVLLDEPTAVLAPPEVTELLHFVRKFADHGGAVVLITHKLDDAMQAADRVTVLRRGQVTLQDRTTNQSASSLARAVIGGDLARIERLPTTPGRTIVHGARVRLGRRGAVAPPVTFDVHAGEIIGIAAIDGNGQRELLRAVAGVDGVPIESGSLAISGRVGFIPEDRTTEGIIGTFSLTENFLLGTLDRAPWWLDWRALAAATKSLLVAHDVRAPGPDVAAASLSGGNQQKFIFGRVLAGNPELIVAEDPTRGLDIQATQAIHDALRAAARSGAGVMVHSSDLDEVLSLADRIFVMARGELTEWPSTTPRDVIGDAMLSLTPAA